MSENTDRRGNNNKIAEAGSKWMITEKGKKLRSNLTYNAELLTAKALVSPVLIMVKGVGWIQT